MVQDGAQHLISSSTDNHNLYRYDMNSDTIKDDGVNSTGMNANLQSQILTERIGTMLTDIRFDRLDVKAKIYPITSD